MSDIPVDVAVSCDGTWQKWGHSSLYGVVLVTAIETGKAFDREVKSRVCISCQRHSKIDASSDEYRLWKQRHLDSDECSWNFEGSANAIEFNNLNDVSAMQKAVHAILYHSASTTKKPMHQFCPTGSVSWCGWQRNSQTNEHHDSIPKAIFQELKHIFSGWPKQSCWSNVHWATLKMPMRHWTALFGSWTQNKGSFEAKLLRWDVGMNSWSAKAGKQGRDDSLKQFSTQLHPTYHPSTTATPSLIQLKTQYHLSKQVVLLPTVFFSLRETRSHITNSPYLLTQPLAHTNSRSYSYWNTTYIHVSWRSAWTGTVCRLDQLIPGKTTKWWDLDSLKT